MAGYVWCVIPELGDHVHGKAEDILTPELQVLTDFWMDSCGLSPFSLDIFEFRVNGMSGMSVRDILFNFNPIVSLFVLPSTVFFPPFFCARPWPRSMTAGPPTVPASFASDKNVWLLTAPWPSNSLPTPVDAWMPFGSPMAQRTRRWVAGAHGIPWSLWSHLWSDGY